MTIKHLHWSTHTRIYQPVGSDRYMYVVPPANCISMPQLSENFISKYCTLAQLLGKCNRHFCFPPLPHPSHPGLIQQDQFNSLNNFN
ncbi:hypothetical protein HOLleu_04112 [Holothuria leucospilota]|uniref:Uncharacterized protein n=1 Tax=Holothuria leucospilota TaxID=206669 RepID=A0A9Q1CSI0_HOLLE|nr:hypothetical protein HOLleu_04112 [Holothuria leucospilota]